MESFKEKSSTLSTLWVFVTMNYLYCDLMGLMDSNILSQYLQGTVEGLSITPTFLLYAGILMELPIAMILFSKILNPKLNIRFNLFASSLKTIVMILTLFIGTSTNYYLFFATIEIGTTIFIFNFTWRMRKEMFSNITT